MLERFQAVCTLEWASRNSIGDDTRASFEFTPSPKSSAFRRYEVSKLYSGEWLAITTPGNSASLHGALETLGATAIRWFSPEEWEAGSAGLAFPY